MLLAMKSVEREKLRAAALHALNCAIAELKQEIRGGEQGFLCADAAELNTTAGGGDVGAGGFSPAVRKALTAINANALDPSFNIKVLRDRCGFRDHNISLRFHAECQMTMKQYLEQIRINTACVLLRGTSLSIWDVCEFVGCPCVQTFYRTFARLRGCTPADYKNRLHS